MRVCLFVSMYVCCSSSPTTTGEGRERRKKRIFGHLDRDHHLDTAAADATIAEAAALSHQSSSSSSFLL